ncbi:AAA family ATPase [Brevibacterium luteolum]|nr:AAA family ATPase [Brevibacterium luteolum]
MLVLSVSSLKGGVGKTSVTLGLASAAYSRGIPTLVIDMDPQADASTGLDIPVRTEVDIADVLAAPRKRILERAVVPSGWVGEQRGHVDVISGSPRVAEFDQPTLSLRYLRRLSEAIHKAGTGYRLVLIDCPPSLNGLTRAAWTASSRVLIVTEPGLFSVAAADRALRATDELRRRTASDLQPLGIVVNRARLQSREHSYRIEELREMFGPLVVNPPIPERTVLQQAQGSARPIHSWPGKPAAELAAALDKILDRALRSERIRRKADAKATPASSTAVADSSGDTQKTEADAVPDEGPMTPKNVGAQDRAGAVEEPATQPAEPTTSTPVEKGEESQKPTDVDTEHDSAPNVQSEPEQPAEQDRDEDEKPSAAPTESDSAEETRSSKEQDAKGTPGALTEAGADGGPDSAAEVQAREEGPSQTNGVRPQSPMGGQPPKPRSAPTVGSQLTGTSVSALPAQPSSQQDDLGVETAAMPLVDTDTGPAQIHEPAGGEEAFLTRRELRERREREKSSKRKWFGR